MPVAIRLSHATGFLDRPHGWKSHARATPILGGAAVVLAFCLAAGAASDDLGRLAPLLAGVVVLAVVGAVDDRVSLKPRHKIPPEVAAATLAWAGGFRWILGGPEALDFLVTVLWVVGVINAINLLDLMDGLATTVTLAAVTACATLAALEGDVVVAGAACALAGACLGFLRFNLAAPARVFLGDGGTIPIGFATAVLAMGAIGPVATSWGSVVAGAVLLAVPLLDMTVRILLRVRRGVSIMTAGPDSTANLLRDRLPSARAVALIAGAIQAGLSAAAVAAVEEWWTAAGIALLLSLWMSLICFVLVKPVAIARAAPTPVAVPAVGVEPPGPTDVS
jgi:UDP-GlcNAc:undecaprenyl-phosphate GlcNAc-1-phosphate transferase